MPADGSDFLNGDILGYQDANEVKNHHRGTAVPANAQPGSLFSDSDDNKLYHVTNDSGPVKDEVLQETHSSDKYPQFAGLILGVTESDVSDPPTDAELDALFTSPASKGKGWLRLVKDTSSGGKMYLVGSDGASWWVLTFALAS